jgi:glycosyltransferase involved in cell wall biosynthesis
MAKTLISIICPVYNEEGSIPIFFRRLDTAVAPLRDLYDFELIFTNNCSSDRTHELASELCRNHAWVRLITLSRNFGYQSSLLSGLHNAKGDATVIIDVDCEDPPEMIPSFLSHWGKGYDIIYGQRHKRPEAWPIQLARKIFYRLTRLIADYDFILDMAEFSLFSRRVRELVLKNRSTYPFIRAEIGFVGFQRLGLMYTREARVQGKTHYNYWRMTQFAIGGILSSSTFFLRLAVYLGFPLAIVNLVLALLSLFFGPTEYFRDFFTFVNWSYAVAFIGVLATYLARIHKDNIQRPLYIIDWDKTILPSRE